MPDRVLPDESRQAFAEAEIQERDRGGVEVALDHARSEFENLQRVIDRLVSRIDPVLDQQGPEDGNVLAREARRPTSALASQIDSHAEDISRLAEHLRSIVGRIDL